MSVAQVPQVTSTPTLTRQIQRSGPRRRAAPTPVLRYPGRAGGQGGGSIGAHWRTGLADVVLTWDGFRGGFNHSDHRAVGIAVRDAIYPAVRDHLYYPDHARAGLEAHQVNEMLLAGTDDPDYHVDIGAYAETKLQAVLCHQSQLGARSREEIERTWRERMRAQGVSRLRESYKRVTIRRSPRNEQPPGVKKEEAKPSA